MYHCKLPFKKIKPNSFDIQFIPGKVSDALVKWSPDPDWNEDPPPCVGHIMGSGKTLGSIDLDGSNSETKQKIQLNKIRNNRLQVNKILFFKLKFLFLKQIYSKKYKYYSLIFYNIKSFIIFKLKNKNLYHLLV